MKDVIYTATYFRNGKLGSISFYNQTFEEIGKQLDVLKDYYGYRIVKIEMDGYSD